MIGRRIPLALIRRLVHQRIMGQLPVGDTEHAAVFKAEIAALSDAQLAGTPEATLVTIVQSLLELRRSGHSAASAIDAVDAFRRATVPGPGRPMGARPVPLFLAYRVLVEHGRVPGVDGEWLGECYYATLAHLECTQDELER